jgi:hypothetical protein
MALIGMEKAHQCELARPNGESVAALQVKQQEKQCSEQGGEVRGQGIVIRKCDFRLFPKARPHNGIDWDGKGAPMRTCTSKRRVCSCSAGQATGKTV